MPNTSTFSVQESYNNLLKIGKFALIHVMSEGLSNFRLQSGTCMQLGFSKFQIKYVCLCMYACSGACGKCFAFISYRIGSLCSKRKSV